MAAGVVVSREVPAPRAAVWGWLADGGVRDPGSRVALGTTLLELVVVDPVDGFTATAVWGGVRHRVAVHLVEQGDAATLLVMTADAEVPDDATGRLIEGGRSALAHRHALRDLAELADRVLERAGAGRGA